MQGNWPGWSYCGKALALAATVFSLCGWQSEKLVSVDETRIRALLQSTGTRIAIPVVNRTKQAVNAQLKLRWLNEDDGFDKEVVRDVVIPVGSSNLEAVVPLQNPSIWSRLSYSVSAAEGEIESRGNCLAVSNLRFRVFAEGSHRWQSAGRGTAGCPCFSNTSGYRGWLAGRPI